MNESQIIEAFMLLNNNLVAAESRVKELTNRVGELEAGMDIILDVLNKLEEEK